MNIPKISKRLEAAASFSRRGARFADVGTDHAYLPIYLHATQNSEGVASDINAGPTERALANVISHGARGAIEVVQTDGLHGIEPYAPEDIFILGMGGELIVKIISEADWLKNEKKRLILQPMTHPEIVREYLYGNGFDVVGELIVKDDKIYQIICAEYSGCIQRGFNSLELLVGRKNLLRVEPILYELLKNIKRVFAERVAGKQSAGADASFELDMIKNIDEILTEDK